jgi:hypothetical protein
VKGEGVAVLVLLILLAVMCNIILDLNKRVTKLEQGTPVSSGEEDKSK